MSDEAEVGTFRTLEQQTHEEVLEALRTALDLAEERGAISVSVVMLLPGCDDAIPLHAGSDPFALVGALEFAKTQITAAVLGLDS